MKSKELQMESVTSKEIEDSDLAAGIGFRLKVERQRLGHTQADCASLGGVSIGSQRFYEAGERLPNLIYFARLIRAGYQGDFILHGEVTTPSVSPVGLDLDLLFEVIELVRDFSCKRTIPVAPDTEAKLIGVLYANASEAGRVNKDIVKNTLELVVSNS